MEFILINQPRVIPRQRMYPLIKRVLDVSTCILCTPVAIPVILICIAAIYLEDPHSPIFFIQQRIGKGGRPFKIYKFRTMKSHADNEYTRELMKAYVRGEVSTDIEGKKLYKPIPAEQIFPIGRFLRKTSLDELPQIINVLNGEMSIVGPRPNVPWEVDAYKPWHHERLEILPGITGLAQVRGRSCIGFNSLVRFDIKYIEQQSLALDIKIIWWTILTCVRAQGVS